MRGRPSPVSARQSANGNGLFRRASLARRNLNSKQHRDETQRRRAQNRMAAVVAAFDRVNVRLLCPPGRCRSRSRTNRPSDRAMPTSHPPLASCRCDAAAPTVKRHRNAERGNRIAIENREIRRPPRVVFDILTALALDRRVHWSRN